MAQEIPVYLFSGFMDSGKSSLIEETLFENDFGEGAKGLIIMCEDGEKEFNEDKLRTINFKVTSIENEEEFTSEKLNEINNSYLPEQVFIEYNGTWAFSVIENAGYPENWHIVQIINIINTIMRRCINREIPHTKRCEILEKVSSLTWLNTIVAQ